jgi:hypothetical protein
MLFLEKREWIELLKVVEKLKNLEAKDKCV